MEKCAKLNVDASGHVQNIIGEISCDPQVVHEGISLSPIYWGSGIVLAAVILVWMTAFTVKQQTVVVIERFGRFKKLAKSGIHFKLPFIDRKAGRVDLRNQQSVFTVETKTLDNVFVNIQVATQFYVDPEKVDTAFYKLDDVNKQMMSYIFDTVRAKVPELTLDNLFAKKNDIADAVKKDLNDTMQGFGYQIVTSLVTSIDPDVKVKMSMNEINAQARMRQAATEQGEASKILTIKKAEAEAESKKLEGEGIANQRLAIIEGLKRSAKDLADATGIKPSEVMSLIMLTQYFDTIKSIGDQKVLFINPSPAGMSDLQDQIKKSIIEGNEASK